MTEHTHDTVPGEIISGSANGTAPQEEQGHQIMLPPQEQMIDKLQQEMGNMAIENFRLRSAAQFESELRAGLQKEVARLSAELSQAKESADKPAKTASARGKTGRS